MASPPTDIDSRAAEAADAKYDDSWRAEIVAAEAEPFEGHTLEECWAKLCEKHPWLTD
jgi:hypothetical protein